MSPSTWGTSSFRSKFTGDPGAGVCDRVVHHGHVVLLRNKLCFAGTRPGAPFNHSD